MDSRHRLLTGGNLIAVLGAGLLAVAGAYHLGEGLSLNGGLGPLLALLLDGTPALALIVAGTRIERSALDSDHQWLILRWAIAGGLLVPGVMLATFAVRVIEGRTVSEPAFPLLIAAGVGSVGGMLAGYFNARAAAEAEHAQSISEGLAFVNRLLRHDLRNDLTAIQGQADLLVKADEEAVRDGAERIRTRAETAMTHIETTRDVAETVAGDAEMEPVDLVTVCATVADRHAADCTLNRDFPEQAPIRANAGVRSVVDNLVENAIQHSNGESHVRLSVTVDDDVVRLTVEDDGPGIPEAVRERVVDPESEHEGGLSLVRALVAAYGGTIGFAEDGSGTTVVVKLPRAGSGD